MPALEIMPVTIWELSCGRKGDSLEKNLYKFSEN
jgi:hypothetical protein